MEQKYLIPKDLRSQIMFGMLTFADIAILLGVAGVGYTVIKYIDMGWIVSTILAIMYMVVGLLLVMKTPDNPDRSRLSVMFTALMNQDTKRYRSIDYNEYTNKTSKERR
ncbi:hypothetical protein L2Z53_12040 (plasmid) [Macrococcoides canis]|uniref:hypothetical protein n=1 Tax=Macrococcoides canis TaxID=1855823 RepID=UPI001F46004F|nr:hypothetical protein [Macrococcus canis]UJS28984.1 hypothetical protein L2Z53_12040 [Macrococcus canis]